MKQNKIEQVDKSLRKGTEGFLSVLDRLEGVDRSDDFKRMHDFSGNKISQDNAGDSR